MRFLTLKAIIGLLAFDGIEIWSQLRRMHKFVAVRKCLLRTAPLDAVNRVCDAVNYACVCTPRSSYA